MNKYERWYSLLTDTVEQNDENFDDFAEVFKELNDERVLYEHEVMLGNYIQSDNIISCIHEGTVKQFELVKKEAEKGDIILITETDLMIPMPKFTEGRFYRVSGVSNGCDIVKNHVIVGYYAVYDNQYLVLKEL